MTVLQRDELEQSPLADLHAIASELGLEGYRRLVKDELIGAIVGAQGGAEEAPATDEKPESEAEAPSRRRQGRRSRSSRGGGSRSRDDEGRKTEEGRKSGGGEPVEAPEASGDDDEDAEREPAAGVLDILGNGSGFLRAATDSESPDDVYVSPAQIRRCELRAGDEVAGRSRSARRNERHPSLVRVEQVNGSDAEPPEQRALFSDLTAVHATERLPVPDSLGSVPIGKGSRVAVAGGPGAGATRLLRGIVASLSSAGDLQVSVVLVGARPEEVTDWRRESGVPVTGDSFDGSDDAQAQATELAVERAKRVAERGGDSVVVIDSLESLPGGAARRLFGAARKLEEGGSLTVIAATGMAWEPQRQASVRVALDGPAEDGSPQVSASRSGALRADLIA
ncbi:MAG: Rho termination factor N-terminal domain-containing protein [Thermoleophilaceae bacterium]